MYRSLLAATLLIPAAAHAQSAPPPPPPAPRQMPSYQDDDAQWRGGYHDSYGTATMRPPVNQTPSPPPVPEGYGYDDPNGGPEPAPADGWKTPKPFTRQDQVDEGRPDDAAHRADRARTSYLNRRPWRGYNGQSGTSGDYSSAHAEYQAELAQHARDMQHYRDEQADYARRMGQWRDRSDACEHGDDNACDTPR